MRIANYRPHLIYPDIPEMTRETYEKGLQCFIDRFLEGSSGKVAIYQFGEIRTPGVSDIDLLIVVKDEEWTKATRKAQAIIGSSGLLSYLFTHEPLVICESLLPSLLLFHTIENCRFVCGNWAPLKQGSAIVESVELRLLRHVIWNSFVRITTLQLDNNRIGLRRALILLHNLLESVQHSNRFLDEPIRITLSTQVIRDEVLSAPLEAQAALTRDYVERVIALLNELDDRLDQEFRVRNWYPSTSSALVVASRRRFLVSPLGSLKFMEDSWHNRFLANTKVVEVPSYLLLVVAALARLVGSQVPQLSTFRRLPVSREELQDSCLISFAEHFGRVVRISEMYGVECFVPMPFSHHEVKLPLKKRLIQQVRKSMLTRKLLA